ncbi:MAG: hypothetical protein AABY14_01915 [Nanoarchaeota archaeon]
MDTSIKIAHSDLILINELKNELRKHNVKTTQKDLIDKTIKFSLRRKKEFLEEFINTKNNDNTKEATNRFINGRRFDLGEKWYDEVDMSL